jgi:hypothetical protein
LIRNRDPTVWNKEYAMSKLAVAIFSDEKKARGFTR